MPSARHCMPASHDDQSRDWSDVLVMTAVMLFLNFKPTSARSGPLSGEASLLSSKALPTQSFPHVATVRSGPRSCHTSSWLTVAAAASGPSFGDGAPAEVVVIDAHARIQHVCAHSSRARAHGRGGGPCM